MVNTKTFDVSYLKRELDLPSEAIYEDAIAEHRWSILYEIVFKDPADGLFWRTTYRSGTGDEGERPWEYDSTVEATQVAPYTVPVTRWKDVP